MLSLPVRAEHAPPLLRALLPVLVCACLAGAVGCSRRPSAFSTDNALAHVGMLARTIGSRPAGTEPNRRARQYVVDTLRGYGFDVRVQQGEGLRPQYGAAARVNNVIAARPGRRPWALALVSHYDSVPDGPGAADAAMGVSVCLETARVLAERPNPTYALIVVITDGEELGLMGATALMKDPVRNWLRGVLNFEAIGSSGPALLFDTAPASGWMLDAWAGAAPRPAGASYMADIYRRLPNDTDLTILGRAGIPGLNFASVEDSYAYHTARDTFERLDPSTIRRMGENALATMEALDGMELPDRNAKGSAVFFDVLRTKAFSYGPKTDAIVLAAALLLGLLGWIQTFSVVRERRALVHLPASVVWAIVCIAGGFGMMLGVAWLLRATRESYHPWYAHPNRFYLLDIVAAVAAIFFLGRLGAWLARRTPLLLRGSTHPSMVWLIVLPLWAAGTIVARLLFPGGVHLAAFPLAAAGVATASLSTRRPAAARIGAAIVLAVSAILWLPNAGVFLDFAVPMLGRAPIVTPIVIFPAVFLFFSIFIAPPLVALLARTEPRVARPSTMRAAAVVLHPGSLLLSALVLAFAWCWFSPAYTHERPLEQHIRYVRDLGSGAASWEIAGNELAVVAAPSSAVSGPWRPVSGPLVVGTPLDQLRSPFIYRAQSTIAAASPLQVSGTLDCDRDACHAAITAVPTREAVIAIFTLPRGVLPEQTSMRGIVEDGSFRATYGAVPPEGITFSARIGRSDCAAMTAATVIAVANGVPGADWPSLPGWLPREHAAWNARSYFVGPVPFGAAGGAVPCSASLQ